MSELRGWHLLPEQHLHPDALVAYVDGELTETAAARAAGHIRTCLSCSAEVCAQRQARGAVRGAEVPSASAGLLASLRAIPTDVDLPSGPDGLAMSEDGELVAAQRPGKNQPLGSSTPLGNGSAVLNTRGWFGRRGAQGAGVVVSGLVLGALALASPFSSGERPDLGEQKRAPVQQAVRDVPVAPGAGEAKPVRAQQPKSAERQRAERVAGEPVPVVRAGN